MTLASAAGIERLDRHPLEKMVGKLHFRSLLEFSADSGRYSMHPLMRQIADEKLKSNPDVEKRVKKNHCIFFCIFTEVHNNDPQALIREKDGIWQALIQANDLDERKDIRQSLIDNLSRYYKNLLKDGRYQDAFNYLLEVNLINIDDIGEVQALVPLLDLLIEHISNLDDGTKGFLYTSRGLAYAALGEYRKAIDLYEKALEISRRIGDIRSEGKTLGNMGLAYADLGEYRKAIEFHEKYLEIARRIGDIRGEGADLGNMGSAFSNLGEYRKAIELYEKQIEIARHIGDIRGEGNALGNMGLAYAKLGDKTKGRQHILAAKKIFQNLGLDHMVRQVDQMLKIVDKM